MLIWLVVAAGFAVGARRLLGGYAAAPIPLEALSRAEYATIAAAALATFPPGGAIPPSGLDAGVPAQVDRFVAAQQPATRRLMRLLFLLVEQSTLVFSASGRGGTRRFSSLSPEQQVEVLDGWRRSSLFARRLVFTSLRAILTMGYFADPVVLRELGLAPRAIDTPIREADLLWPPIGASPGSLRLTRADLTPPAEVVPLGATGALHADYVARAAEAKAPFGARAPRAGEVRG